MRFALATASKDLRRRFADPAALALWIGLPIVLGSLMSLLGSGGSGPRAHVLLADEDHSLIGRFLAAAARQDQAARFLDLELVTAAQGRQRMAAGDATALIILPAGFQDAVLNEMPTVVTLVTNPAQRILPSIVEEGLKMAAEASFYAQRLFGEPMRRMANGGQAGGPTDDFVASISRAINQDITRIRSTLLPPVIALETKTESDQAASPGFGTLFLPGLLFMSVLFMANGMSLDIWVEKERGTLRRVVSAPQSLASFLAGKLMASVALMTVIATIALVLSVVVFNVRPLRLPAALVWVGVAGAALFCYFVLLQLLGSSARGAGIIGQMVVFPLMMLGGSVFPFDLMPAWMAAIGRWTPNGLAVTHIRALLFEQPDWQAIAIATPLLALPAAGAFWLSVRRIRRRFATS